MGSKCGFISCYLGGKVGGTNFGLCGRILVSCNVMTFKQHYVSAYVAVSTEVALLAVQETRLKKLAFQDEQYLIRSHPAHKGQGGVLLALHPELFKIYDAQGQRITLQDQHWTVVASNPECIVTRLWCGPVDILIANLHVPHSGKEDMVIAQYWTDFHQTLPSQLRSKPMILLGDMNARLGSACVGGHAMEEENQAGTCMIMFCDGSNGFLQRLRSISVALPQRGFILTVVRPGLTTLPCLKTGTTPRPVHGWIWSSRRIPIYTIIELHVSSW